MASHFFSVASIHFNSIFRVSSVYSLLSITHIYQICCLSSILVFLFVFYRATIVYSPTSIFYIYQICMPFFLYFSLLHIPLIIVCIVYFSASPIFITCFSSTFCFSLSLEPAPLQTNINRLIKECKKKNT